MRRFDIGNRTSEWNMIPWRSLIDSFNKSLWLRQKNPNDDILTMFSRPSHTENIIMNGPKRERERASVNIAVIQDLMLQNIHETIITENWISNEFVENGGAEEHFEWEIKRLDISYIQNSSRPHRTLPMCVHSQQTIALFFPLYCVHALQNSGPN